MKLCESLLLLFIGFGIICVGADDANDENQDDSPEDEIKEPFRNLVRPFRMEKLNLVWVKAQQVNNECQSPCFVCVERVTLFLTCI